jgi:hypothetical protein
MSFRVNQRVVCIHRGEWVAICGCETPAQGDLPHHGGVYTIAYIEDVGDVTFLGLVEVDARHSFDAAHFRPVIERSTEARVSELKKLLNPQQREVERV